MDDVYRLIRNRAREIVARFPVQPFYTDFPLAVEQSRRFFQTNPVINAIKDFIAETIGENLGHGLDHAVKVTLDAGSLIIIEGEEAGYSRKDIDRRVLLAQCSGLFHDIKRDQQSHAEKGALFARETLRAFACFDKNEIDDISNAISNHEAFKSPVEIKTLRGALVSDCLYDADKFRWGPDNFTHTVWDMLMISRTPVSTFFRLYPKGIKGLAKIKDTFRTKTGKKYGPLFIDTGLTIGAELYEVIRTEFAEYLDAGPERGHDGS
ncbi:MAG: hypothetical protein ACOZF0_16320 [Thermodesulfobacteriota bacterium]